MDRFTFRQLFQALPSPHMILDRELCYVAANPAYEKATGRREAELAGRHVAEAFPNEGEAGARLLSSLNKVVATGQPDTLAYIHYAIPRADPPGGVEDRYWTAVHTPLFGDDGEVVFVLQNTVDITEIVGLREAATVPFRIFPGEVELVQRAREAEAAVARDGQADFGRLFQEGPGMVAVLQGPRHVFTFANDVYRRYVGNRPVLGLPVREALPELAGQWFFERLDGVFQTGDPVEVRGVRIVLQRSQEREPEECFMDLSFRAIRDDTSGITGVFVQASDRTDSVRAGERQRLLLDELNHRVKNTLSAVQSIARQSFRGNYDPAVAQATFDSRVRALSKAHDVLSDRHWESADLRTVLMQELSIYDGERIEITGPTARLKPRAVIAFAMVFHELASNAVKYGALSTSGGELRVNWSCGTGPDARLTGEWREIGADIRDAVVPAFGIKMLRRIITGELDGRLDLAFEPNGLICRFDVPMSEVEDFAGS